MKNEKVLEQNNTIFKRRLCHKGDQVCQSVKVTGCDVYDKILKLLTENCGPVSDKNVTDNETDNVLLKRCILPGCRNMTCLINGTDSDI
jgi:hypothetical protein